GVDVRFVIYDLLPVQFPEFWEPQHSVHLVASDWMKVVSRFGGAVCISRSVANEWLGWVQANQITCSKRFKLDWFHLGADPSGSVPSRGLPKDAYTVLEKMQQRPNFLMVGTLEPRKGHAQVLDAFERLWGSNLDVSLTLFGKQGWMVERLAERIR